MLVIVSLGFIAAPWVYLFTGWPAFADYQLPIWAGWIGTIIFAGALVLVWRSMSIEERMMLDRFGEEYKLYMNRTGRIFPRFWG